MVSMQEELLCSIKRDGTLLLQKNLGTKASQAHLVRYPHLRCQMIT